MTEPGSGLYRPRMQSVLVLCTDQVDSDLISVNCKCTDLECG